MTQINWQYQVNNRAGGYIVTNTDWNDVAGDLRAFIDQTTSSTTDNTPLPIGIDLANDRVYISDPDSTTPEDANHADTTLSVVGTTTLTGDLSLGTTTAGETNNIAGVTTASGGGSNLILKGGDATGTNQGGGYLAIKPGMGTGSGVSGDLLLQTGPAGASGATQNTATTVLTCTSAGTVQIDGNVTLGVDDTGHDWKAFGATSGSYALWDESDDALRLVGADLVPASAMSNRNKIINGDMRVSQREQTYTTGTGGGTRYYPADRFWTGDYTWSAGSDITISRDDAVYPTGFSQSYKVASGGTGLTYASGGHTGILYSIEAQDLEPYYAETAMTLSFWCRSTDTGIFNVLFANGWYGSGRADRGLTKEFTISSADTWEHKTITIDLAAGTAAGTWKTGTDEGLLIAWMLGGNANRTGDDYLDTWATWSALALNTDSNIQLMTGANSNFYLAGVQFEVGSNATPFEHRDIGSELARCQRYFYEPANTENGAAGDGASLSTGLGYNYSTTAGICWVEMPVPMRATPTITSAVAELEWATVDAGARSPGSLAIFGDLSNNKTIAVNLGSMATMTTQIGGWLRYEDGAVAAASLQFYAELS